MHDGVHARDTCSERERGCLYRYDFGAKSLGAGEITMRRGRVVRVVSCNAGLGSERTVYLGSVYGKYVELCGVLSLSRGRNAEGSGLAVKRVGCDLGDDSAHNLSFCGGIVLKLGRFVRLPSFFQHELR
jgi:hypothetical protein